MSAALLVVLIGAEVALRWVPAVLPSGAYYGSGIFHPGLGFRLPHSTVVYNKVRYLHRTPNADGMMDVDHDRQKPAGTLRVGFFGDSYVESIQVPLEQVFFRQLPPTLNDRPIEWFGFGLSGLGTLHSQAMYEQFADLYDLDVAVYLFVNNDPSDHLHTVQSGRGGIFAVRPSAASDPSPKGYRVVPAPPESGLRRLALAVKERSLLARVVYSRIQLIGVSRGNEGYVGLSGPSQWDPDLRAEASAVSAAVLRSWRDSVHRDGRQFAVFYVPTRAEIEPDSKGDSWRSWLDETCALLEIHLMDPTEDLTAVRRSGTAVYSDHWTREGHLAVASVIEAELRGTISP